MLHPKIYRVGQGDEKGAVALLVEGQALEEGAVDSPGRIRLQLGREHPAAILAAGAEGAKKVDRGRNPQSFLECLSHQDSENIARC